MVTLGETMALLTSSRVGPLRHAATLELHIAGTESNVAIGVARLGGRAAWIGRVGADELGQLVLDTLRGEGVDVSAAVVDDGAPTSLMLKERRTAELVRVSYYRRGGPGARLQPADLDEDRLRGAGVVHVTGITAALSESARLTVRAAVETARAAARPVSLDCNYRSALWGYEHARAELQELARMADVVVAAEVEAELVTGESDPEAAVRAIVALGAGGAIVTLGDRGALALLEGELVTVAPVPVRAVDPVGAGDAFVAGYLAELLDGRPQQERLETAARCGAFAVTVDGDWEGLPSRDELVLLGRPPGTVLR